MINSALCLFSLRGPSLQCEQTDPAWNERKEHVGPRCSPPNQTSKNHTLRCSHCRRDLPKERAALLPLWLPSSVYQQKVSWVRNADMQPSSLCGISIQPYRLMRMRWLCRSTYSQGAKKVPCYSKTQVLSVCPTCVPSMYLVRSKLCRSLELQARRLPWSMPKLQLTPL